MTFANPENLVFFALIAVLVIIWIGHGMWHRRVRNRSGDRALVDAMTASVSRRKMVVRRLMQIVGLALVVIAIARPQWGMSDEYVEDEALDVVFTLDLSNSMLAEDVPPNRLQAAQQAVGETMQHMVSDRVGLVIFTSISFVQSPLTTDYSTIDFFLDRLHPDQIPVGGTNIGAAIQDSKEVLGQRRHGDDSELNAADEQVIVLLTDGEDHESSPSRAADEAREAGIRVVTIGIGSPDGARVPRFDERGDRIGWAEEDGEPVYTVLDEEALRDVADRTDGAYIHFETPRQTAGELIEILDRLERTAIDQRITEQYIDRFMWFLIPGFALLLMSLLIGRRRRQIASLRRLLPFGMLCIVMATGCDADFERSIPESEQLEESITDGDYESALEILDELAADYGDEPKYHFNRGRAYLGLERHREARASLADALATDDPDLRADVHYHLGLIDAELEDWSAAREHFRRGLREFVDDPGASDADTHRKLQHNLEIALRQLFPPCSEFEDDFEPNSSPGEAAELEEFDVQGLTLCADSDDYFALPAIAGSTISIEARAGELRDEPDPEQAFLPEAEGLTLELLDSDGATVLGADDGADTDADELHRQNRERRAARSIDSVELRDADGGNLFVALRAGDGLEYSYDLHIDYDAPCDALDDDFEPNSTADDAAQLEPGTHEARICPGDEDWFRLRPDYDDSIFVDLQPRTDRFDDEAPELELELIRADTGEMVSTGQPDGQALTAGIDGVDFGTDILARVQGADEHHQGPYTVDVHHFQPCPDGTDHLSPNDSPTEASQLDPEQNQHRYLRLCDGETDYHQAPVGEDGRLQWSLRVLPDDAWRHDDERIDSDQPFGEFPLMQLDLLDDRFQVHTPAKEADVDSSDDDATDSAPPALTDDRHLSVDDPPDEEVAMLRVDGESGFYHLSRPDDGSGDDDQQQDGDDDEQQDGDDSQQQGDQDVPDEDPREMSQDEIDDVLRSLEGIDQNFQLQQAIEEAPTRQPQKEW